MSYMKERCTTSIANYVMGEIFAIMLFLTLIFSGHSLYRSVNVINRLDIKPITDTITEVAMVSTVVNDRQVKEDLNEGSVVEKVKADSEAYPIHDRYFRNGWSTNEVPRREYIPEPVDIYIEPTLNFNDVTELSGSNAYSLNVILEDTWLEGYGELFYELEQKHGVNAMFAIGNAILETGWKGDSYIATNYNNIFGLTDRRFESKGECIEYYFDLIDTHYVGEGYRSMSQINEKYCPPNPEWCYKIESIANTLISDI